MKFMFEFTEEEINAIVSGLHEIPLRVSLPLIRNIQFQVMEQIKGMHEMDKIRRQKQKKEQDGAN